MNSETKHFYIVRNRVYISFEHVSNPSNFGLFPTILDHRIPNKPKQEEPEWQHQLSLFQSCRSFSSVWIQLFLGSLHLVLKQHCGVLQQFLTYKSAMHS